MLRIVIALFLLVACSTAPAPDAPPTALRLVCWNIHHGRGLDGKVDVVRIANELRAMQADVVCLQEVDVGVRRSGGLDLPQELAARLHFHAAFGKNIDFQGGDYGNAILSRFPIAEQHNHHYAMLRPNEQRGLLRVRLRLPGRELWVLSTHLDYRGDDAERRTNVAEIRACCGELASAPFVVAGDFNDLPGSAVHQALGEDLLDAFALDALGGESYPAAAPTKRIDWVLVPKDGRVRPVATYVAATAASDHRPVVVDLAVR